MELIVCKSHKLVHYNGIKETLNNTRESYWTLRGQEAVKLIVRNCVLCKIFKGKPFGTPTTAELPTSQVSDELSFANTGVDFMVPLYVNTQVRDRVGQKMKKAYVCLRTCAMTRAVHLDLVPNLTFTFTFLQVVHIRSNEDCKIYQSSEIFSQ